MVYRALTQQHQHPMNSTYISRCTAICIVQIRKSTDSSDSEITDEEEQENDSAEQDATTEEASPLNLPTELSVMMVKVTQEVESIGNDKINLLQA